MTDDADPWIEAITPERIERALAGFPLQLSDDWDMARLTLAIQRMANLGRDRLRIGPERQSDKDAKRELNALARKASAVLRGLEAPGYSAFYAVIMRAALTSKEETDHLGYASDDYQRDFVEPLRKITRILTLAAADVGARPGQKPRWTEREAHAMRVLFASELAGLFESAFGQEAKAHNWAMAYDDQPQPWPDFYRRLYGELFGQTAGLNLSEVLQEAARMRKGTDGRLRKPLTSFPFTSSFLETLRNGG